MERDIMHNLVEWKNSDSRKPLILKGARQVGKTYTLREFGRKHYRNTIYINCDNDIAAQNILTRDYDISRIIVELSAYSGININPADTLLIFDEIQEIPKGLHLLKYFCENAPEYHVAVAGSLLGIAMHHGESFPVGKVDMLTMYPMTFTEFLKAMGHEKYAEIIADGDFISVNDLLPSINTILRQYYFVGGMPAIVKTFIEYKDVNRVRDMQNILLMNYRADISKHAPLRDVPRINQVWESIPSQLARENKKFIFGAIRKGARATDFEVAIQWLVDAGLAYKVRRISKPSIPLNFYADFQSFKLYVLDCGLLGAMSNAPAEMMLVSDNVFVEFKGAFTEQYVLQQLVTAVKGEVYYYSNERSTQEIDFIFQRDVTIVPMEVKAEVSVKAKSFKQFLSEYPDLHGVRVSMLPYRREERFTNIPLGAVIAAC